MIVYKTTNLVNGRKKISLALTGKYVGPKHHLFGKSPSKETLKRLSESHKGKRRPLSLTTREKISRSLMGHGTSDSIRKKIAQTLTGKTQSEISATKRQ